MVKQTNKTRSASSYFFSKLFLSLILTKAKNLESLFTGFLFFFFFLLLTIPPGASGELATLYLLEYGFREGGGSGEEGMHSSTVYHNILAKGNQI